MDNLAKDKTSKLLVKYSIPAIIAMLVTCLYNTADRAFIGSMEGVGVWSWSYNATVHINRCVWSCGICWWKY